MKGSLEVVLVMAVTHAPYWLAAAAIVVLVRRMRRSLEALVHELRERGLRRP